MQVVVLVKKLGKTSGEITRGQNQEFVRSVKHLEISRSSSLELAGEDATPGDSSIYRYLRATGFYDLVVG